MSNVQEISKFVEQIFDRYQMNKYDFFFTLDDQTMEEIPQPLFPTGELDDEILHKIATRIGLTKSEIINMDMKAAAKYWNKYPFFLLYSKYMDAWHWHQNFADEMPTAEELLLRAMFSDEENIYGKERYNMDDLRVRLTDTLKEIDQVLPGTYHKGAEITNLRIFTQIFFSFPQCGDMIRSFIDMVKRTEELFFLALHKELNEEDANELNFLASWLNAVDVIAPSRIISYDNVCTYRKVYLEENSQDFFFYVKIKSFVSTDPWRCQEFFDDMDLVREFLYIFPHAKAQMREFARDITKFSCFFVWSDAEPIRFSDEDEQMFAFDAAMFGYEPLDDSRRAKEMTHVYVSKKPEEMPGWEPLVERLKKASGPTSKGGVAVPHRDIVNILTNPKEALQRMQRRVEAKYGGASNG